MNSRHNERIREAIRNYISTLRDQGIDTTVTIETDLNGNIKAFRVEIIGFLD